MGQVKREGGKEGNRRMKKAKTSGRQKLLGVQTQACTIQPLWMGGTHATWGFLRASKTAVGGPENGNADAIVHKATDHWIWSVTFFSTGECYLTNHSINFMAKETISRHYTGSEMALLSKTRSKIFLLLGFLMGGQHVKRVLGLISFGICVSNLDIWNTISTTGPETTDKKITLVITGDRVWGGCSLWCIKSGGNWIFLHIWVPIINAYKSFIPVPNAICNRNMVGGKSGNKISKNCNNSNKQKKSQQQKLFWQTKTDDFFFLFQLWKLFLNGILHFFDFLQMHGMHHFFISPGSTTNWCHVILVLQLLSGSSNPEDDTNNNNHIPHSIHGNDDCGCIHHDLGQQWCLVAVGRCPGCGTASQCHDGYCQTTYGWWL